MKPRFIFLIISLTACLASIILILTQGTPVDKVSLDSVSQMGENFLHHADKSVQMLILITDEEEMKIGDIIHKKILRRGYQTVDDKALTQYVKDIGNQLITQVKRPGIKYNFHVIKESYLSAFAGAGGHVYISAEFLSEIESEAELAGILAHEITHIDAKHCIGAIQYKVAAHKIFDPDLERMTDIGGQIFLRAGYSEMEEFEADAGGAYLTYQAGYCPWQNIKILNRIRRRGLTFENEDQTSSSSPIEDTAKAVGEMINRYFKTHPPTEDRIKRIRSYLKYKKLSGRFYVGKRNYKEKIPKTKKAYKKEFLVYKDSVIVRP